MAEFIQTENHTEVLPKPAKLFDLKKAAHSPLNRAMMTLLASPLEEILRLSQLNDVYSKIVGDAKNNHFFDKCLEQLNIQRVISDADLRKIPETGPLVTVANHPFGGLEGIVLGGIMARVRPDVKILGNYLLQHLPEIKDQVIPVDVFGNRNSRPGNALAIKEAIQWVERGGALITFPSGEVSHIHLRRGEVSDPPWNPHIGGIIRHARSTVLPVYFPGQNSLLFQVLGLLHPLLRTALLPRELFNKRSQPITVFIGKPIAWKTLADADSDKAMMRQLRAGVYFLQNRAIPDRRHFTSFPFLRARQTPPEPIVPPVAPGLLQQEIRGLPADSLLVATREFNVYIASADRIGHMLREIGRLRETVFRDVKEGTGKALDLDDFDKHYLHLFLWNNAAGELAGAYRLGLSDVIQKRFGIEGLYTSTLFRYEPGFLANLGNAIELGRSFIVSKYQKEYNCLSLLWKGIGQFIVRNPSYNILFGPVSISDDYQVVSKHLIVQFLRQNKLDAKLARYVHPRVPCRIGRVKTMEEGDLQALSRNMDDISLLISEIEKDGKGVPILLRHYLKLNASILCFNLDPSFARVIDGLMRVDLTKTDTRLLHRFMGDAGIRSFANYHGMTLQREHQAASHSSPPVLDTTTERL